MSLTVKYAPTVCECDGSNRRFSTLWPFFDAADLRVTWVSASGNSRRLEVTDYKARGGRDANGVSAVGWIETAKIFALKDRIIIERDTVRSQEEAFQDGGAFPGKRVERALDRAMMALEEIAFKASGQSPAVATAPIAADADLGRQALDAARGLQQELRALRRMIDGDQQRAAATVTQHVPAMPIAAPEAPVPAVVAQPVGVSHSTASLEFPNLLEAQRHAFDELGHYAAAARAQFATPGKDLVYIQKQNEAKACLDDDEPLAATVHPVTGGPIVKYPHLEGMIGVYVPETSDRVTDLMTAAAFILGKAADWKANSARVEAALAAGKQALAVATTIEDALSIPARVIWPRVE